MLSQQLYPSYPLGKSSSGGGALPNPLNIPDFDKWVTARFVSVNLDPTESGFPSNRIIDPNDPLDGMRAIEEVAVLHDSPYGLSDERNKLRPINNFFPAIKGRIALVTQARFYTIGTRSRGSAPGSSVMYTAEQVNNVITNSLDSPNYAYNQGGMIHTPIASHQPNWFAPTIKINGVDIVSEGQSTAMGSTDACDTMWITDSETTSAGKGLSSLGQNLPFDFIAVKRYIGIYQVEIKAQNYQIINMGTPSEPIYRYQRYPIFCDIDFAVLRTPMQNI